MSVNKQITFNLPEGLIEKMNLIVQQKIEPSKNALVRKSIEQYLEKLEQEVLQKQMEEAVQDEKFMDDLKQSMKNVEGESSW